jgi:cytoskeletal protein CcmA (bactofilin family)
MKWMGSNKAPAGAEDWIGFLDKGVKLEGTLELAGTFRIDGEVHGAVRSKERVIIGESGRVEGEVIAAIVTVSGKVNGKVNGLNRVEIQPTGAVEGEVFTPCLVIEAGGVIEGRCHMRAETKPQRAPQPMPVPAHAGSSS